MRNYLTLKKYLYILFALPLMIGITSCSDDDDDEFPPVDITVNIEGATRVDDTLYVVQGDVLSVSAINMTDRTSKGAVVGGVTYYWDYYRVGGTIEKPFGMDFDTAGVDLGYHLLQIRISIYAVDYSPCMGYISYKIKIVPSASDIPTTGDIEHNPAIKAAITANTDMTAL